MRRLRLNKNNFTRIVGIKLSNEFDVPPLSCIIPVKFLIFLIILPFRYFFEFWSLPSDLQIEILMICFTIIIFELSLFLYAKNRCNRHPLPLFFDTNVFTECKAPIDFLFINLKDWKLRQESFWGDLHWLRYFCQWNKIFCFFLTFVTLVQYFQSE